MNSIEGPLSGPPPEVDPPISVRAWNLVNAPPELRKLLPPGTDDGWLVWVCAEFSEDFLNLLTLAWGDVAQRFSRYELANGGGMVVSGPSAFEPLLDVNPAR